MILRNEYYKAKSLTVGVVKSFFAMSYNVVRRLYGAEKITTINYPVESYLYSSNQYGLPRLTLDNKGRSLCTSCDECQKICPTEALEISGTESKEPEVFNLDVGKCIFCGLCAEVCPEKAIEMGDEHIIAAHIEESLVYSFNELKTKGRRLESESQVKSEGSEL
jgi:NADH-quinone oxidoreductase subunit I